MADLQLSRYSQDDAAEWDAFVERSRNGTFLFMRGYMDYHADRFADHSMILRKGGRIVALLPADIYEEDGRRILRSHGGLTYGGWILPPRHTDAMDVLEFFRLLGDHAVSQGISSLDYKPVPFIYQRMPSQEDLYALFRERAVLTERNLSCAIDLRANPGLNSQQRRNLRKGEAVGSEIIETCDCAPFHALLSACLMERHGVTPVHSAGELQLLKERFPENIRIFLIRAHGEAQAGVCVFDTGMVAHAQYICSTPRGRAEGLLTLLFTELIGMFPHCRYFDFGISNEDHGLYLNEGLYRQKSSLGGSGVVYERYRLVYDAGLAHP